jgi:hypothetical protein
MVYPGAMHTRFEHSLGVMHIATRMYKQIVKKNLDFLKTELRYDDEGLKRDKLLVRLAALLHDVGHAPFSHAGEGMMDANPETGKPYEHEDYSAAIIQNELRDVIENHPENQNYHIKAEEIGDFLKGKSPKLGRRGLLWRSLITGQLDADRADYLLRDSHHMGVAYGKYDLERLLFTMTIAVDKNTKNPTIGIQEGGFHAAEALIIARYMMFTQVYFHHTRRIYDHHIGDALKTVLAKETGGTGAFPTPTSIGNIKKYLSWDDWKVLGLISKGEAGSAGTIISDRAHDRSVYETREVPTEEDLEEIKKVIEDLGDRVSFIDTPEKSWYKVDRTEISILKEDTSKEDTSKDIQPLSEISIIVKALQSIKQKRVYVPLALKDEAERIVSATIKKGGKK